MTKISETVVNTKLYSKEDSEFESWLNTFISEKGFDLSRSLSVEGSLGVNIIPLGMIVDAIKAASTEEQKAIKAMLIKIDFHNGDCLHFFHHLAKAIVA